MAIPLLKMKNSGLVYYASANIGIIREDLAILAIYHSNVNRVYWSFDKVEIGGNCQNAHSLLKALLVTYSHACIEILNNAIIIMAWHYYNIIIHGLS